MTQEWRPEDQMGRFEAAPGVLTVVAKGMVTVGNALLFIPGSLISLPFLLTLSIVKRFIPGGVLLINLFSIPWLVLLFILTGTSWLWEKASFLRLLLIPIGVPCAWLGGIYLKCIPDDPDDRWRKLALADQWPLTFDLWRQVREQSR